MIQVKKIFEQIQATSGKLDKEQIIRDNKDNIDFSTALHFLLNSFIVTGLSSKKINKKISVEPTENFKDGLEVMIYLNRFNTGTDEIISNVQNFINNQPEDMREFYTGLFTKSLKLGCAESTVNKAFGKQFVPQFKIQLADKYFDNVDRVDGKSFTLTTKLDGIRAIIIRENEKISIFSRQGQPIEGLVDIETELLNHSTKRFVLDGELLITDTDNLESKDQYKATTKIVRKDGIKTGITFRAFDILTVDEFQNQKCDTEYKMRRKALELTFGNREFVKVLPVLYSGDDMSQIAAHLDKAKSNGDEGIMLNLNNGLYEFKRSKNLLKVKVMMDSDLRVIGVYEGTGKYKGKLGGIEVEFIHNDKVWQCNCGSGFCDEERELYWNQPDLLIRKIVTIQYFEITQNDSGGFGLRFPIWVGRIRHDKKEISMA
jgi:DNA ligase-1